MKKYNNRLIGILVSVAVLGNSFALPVNIRATELAVRENIEQSASDGTVIIGVEGYECTSAQKDLLDLVNKVRLEACQEGVPDPRDHSKSLTTDDYVPIKLGVACTKAAKLRAAEADVYLGHIRPDGGDCFNVLRSFISYTAMGENLAWSGGSGSDIQGWIDEKEDYVGGDFSTATGHYESLIDPDFRYTGMATFNPVNDNLNYNWSCTAGQYAGSDEEITEFEDAQNNLVIQKMPVKADYIKTMDISGPAVMQINGTASYRGVVTVTCGGVRSNTITGCPVYSGAVFTSSDPGVLEISQDGNALAKAEGSAVITAVFGGSGSSKKVERTIVVGEDVQITEVEDPDTIVVESKGVPELPGSVTAVLSDGSKISTDVIWDEYDSSKLLTHFKSEEFDVTGKAAGFDVVQKVHVNAARVEKVYVSPDQISTDYGVLPQLPAKVKINLSNGYTWTYNANWNVEYKEYCNNPQGGTYTITGYATPAVTTDEGTVNLDFSATLLVTPENGGPVPTATPTPTPTPTPDPAVTPAPTGTPAPDPTVTPMPTGLPSPTPIDIPTISPIPTGVPTGIPTISPSPTDTPTINPVPSAVSTKISGTLPDDQDEESDGEYEIEDEEFYDTIGEDGVLDEGTCITDKDRDIRIKVTSDDADDPQVSVISSADASGSVNIPDTVTIHGVVYSVVSIAPGAFKNNKKATKITLGKNVMGIGKKAFYNSGIKKITIKSKKMTKKTVKAKAFSGLGKGVTVKVPGSKKKIYALLFKSRGLNRSAKVK